MKQIKGWCIPKWDSHFEHNLQLQKNSNTWEYQHKQRQYALSFVHNWNLALDIGGNVGFWSQDLCKKFDQVWAFEPHPDNTDCYKENMKNFSNWRLEELALSDHLEKNAVLFASPDESGNISLNSHGVTHGSSVRVLKEDNLTTTYTEVRTLDSYINEFSSQNIDFIKVDSQEHEKEIMLGGLELLKKHETVIVLELPCRNQKEKKYHDDIVDILKDIGYYRRGNCVKETVFTKGKQ